VIATGRLRSHSLEPRGAAKASAVPRPAGRSLSPDSPPSGDRRCLVHGDNSESNRPDWDVGRRRATRLSARGILPSPTMPFDGERQRQYPGPGAWIGKPQVRASPRWSARTTCGGFVTGQVQRALRTWTRSSAGRQHAIFFPLEVRPLTRLDIPEVVANSGSAARDASAYRLPLLRHREA
jgi:hypothetical protein